MSWKLARQRIVDVISDVTPSDRARGLPAKFKHDTNGSEASPPGDSRRFWLRTTSGAGLGPNCLRPVYADAVLMVVVEYVEDCDTDRLDVAMVDDATAIMVAVSDPGNWQHSTSTIEVIDFDGSTLAPYEIEQAEGFRRLRMTLNVRYRV